MATPYKMKLDSDGTINRGEDQSQDEELDPLTKAMSKIHEHIQSTRLKVSQIFNDLDSSGDGLLDAVEFRAGVRKILDKALFSLDADMIEDMFKRVDQDRSGSINWKEFLRSIREADLERVKAVKARRDAANTKMENKKPSQKKKKKKSRKKVDWRENRKGLLEGSPHILRWLQQAAHMTLEEEDGSNYKRTYTRRNYVSSYSYNKKPSLLKRAVESLPSLRDNEAKSCLLPDKKRGMHVKVTFPGNANLGGSVSGYMTIDALGKDSLVFDTRKSARKSNEEWLSIKSSDESEGSLLSDSETYPESPC